jgi:hypothetical protein
MRNALMRVTLYKLWHAETTGTIGGDKYASTETRSTASAQMETNIVHAAECTANANFGSNIPK